MKTTVSSVEAMLKFSTIIPNNIIIYSMCIVFLKSTIIKWTKFKKKLKHFHFIVLKCSAFNIHSY